MGFTFDASVSATTSAYDKAHRRQSTVSMLPSRPRKSSIASSSSSSTSLLDNVTQHVRNPFRRSSTSKSSTPAPAATNPPSKPVPAAESPFFRLPLEIRETIYGHVVGRHEMLHIMMKRHRSKLLHPLVHRRCRAGGDLDDCILHDCKRFLAPEGGGYYFGSFGRVGGLLFSCRDIFNEASNVLYTQNTFDFDHPRCFMIFEMTVPPATLNSIKSLSINLQRELYDPGRPDQTAKSLRHDEWPHMWDIIAGMEGLEQIRVRFRFLVKGWLGWSEEEVLEPLWKVTRPMKVFEVDSRRAVGFKDEETAERAPFKLLGAAPKYQA